MNNKTIDPNSTITITEEALKQVKQVMTENNIPKDYALRIIVRSGGCSGLRYNLGFDGEERDGDTIFNDKDLKIVVDGKSLFHLMGTELDYGDGPYGKNFIFNNPNATDTCDCGASFGA
ncbi:MAG: iron-sulfur cluster assembly accessory protein [Ignavibacteriae bacterium]|nr:MAG: iron-sulfur cluster assembly accessory protein [Ignavibacteriota bacterium]